VAQSLRHRLRLPHPRLLDLYQAGFDVPTAMGRALQRRWTASFLDKEKGGYYSVHTDMAHSVLRIKEDYDGAEPSPNSLAALNLARLAAMLDDKAHGATGAEAPHALRQDPHKSSPSAVPMLVTAADFLERGKQQIVLAGDKHRARVPSSAQSHALAPAPARRHPPRRRRRRGRPGSAQHNEALAEMKPVSGKPAAYVCQNYTCQAPVTEAAALEKLLG
jgi:uncharacterized protein